MKLIKFRKLEGGGLNEEGGGLNEEVERDEMA